MILGRRGTISYVLDIGYALSNRFPDPPQTDYRRADVHALRHDLFCGDVYLADTDKDRELSTAWGWVPVLDFAWALCDIVERLDRDPAGSRASRPQYAELDFTESTDRMLFERRFGYAAADYCLFDEDYICAIDGYRVQTVTNVAREEPTYAGTRTLIDADQMLMENYAVLVRQ